MGNATEKSNSLEIRNAGDGDVGNYSCVSTQASSTAIIKVITLSLGRYTSSGMTID